ncbi:MAG: hypothetical protein NZ602_05535 [Thermoguttaceae bacterium]|nr:hypothetical protein [Thermoguttaceae bacterium]MDW8038844.1 hypothetical protein [Thermoguttaceae bacterium]
MGKYLSLAIVFLVSLVVLVVVIVLGIRGCVAEPLVEQKQNPSRTTREGLPKQKAEGGLGEEKTSTGKSDETNRGDFHEEASSSGGSKEKQQGGTAGASDAAEPGGSGGASPGKAASQETDRLPNQANGEASGSSTEGTGSATRPTKLDPSELNTILSDAERLRTRAHQLAQQGKYGQAYAEVLQAWTILRPAARYEPKCQNLMQQLESLLRRYGELANQNYTQVPLGDKPFAIENRAK